MKGASKMLDAFNVDYNHITHLQCLEKYCGYGYLSDKEGNPILMSLLGNMDVEGTVAFEF